MRKHCQTCSCSDTCSDERKRLKKLFNRVPDFGCLDYRAGGYCGQPCEGGIDYCKRHSLRG